MYKRDRKFMKS